MEKKKKNDVEISNEVSTNDYQTHALKGNHVRNLIRNDLGKVEKQAENHVDDFKEDDQK